MNVQDTKERLIQWLTALEDEQLLEQVLAIKEQSDWWNKLSQEEKAAIEEGTEELNRGEGIPHEIVMKEMREKYGLEDHMVF